MLTIYAIGFFFLSQQSFSFTFAQQLTTEPIISLCTGYNFACTLYETYKMKCWGAKSSFGASTITGDINLGDTITELGDAMPYLNVGTNSLIRQASCGKEHICVRLDNGHMKCLGSNYSGQIGLGLTTSPIGETSGHVGDVLPVVNIGDGLQVLDLALGHHYTCIVTTGNNAKCFGSNWFGQLGYGDKTSRGTSSSDMSNSLPFIDFGTNIEVDSLHSSPHSQHNCIILSAPTTNAGRFKCWGFNYYYQLGYGDIDNRGDNSGEMGDNLPLVDIGVESRVKQIATGYGHTCAVLISGILKCWGQGSFGQLGLGSNYDMSLIEDSMPLVKIDPGKKIMQVSAGGYHTCILYDDMTSVKCFGYNQYGQLGQGDTAKRGESSTTKIPSIPTIDFGIDTLNISSIHCGYFFNCVIFSNSIIKCFGDNQFGQLGIGSTGIIGDEIKEMGVNLHYTVLLGTSPTQSPTLSPTKAPTTEKPPTKSIIGLCLGTYHTCVLFDNKKMKCVGDQGAFGSGNSALADSISELGDSIPYVNIGENASIEQISCGSGHTCVRLDSGNLKCLGGNGYGEIGIGLTTSLIDKSNGYYGDALPIVNFGSGLQVLEVALGFSHSCVLLTGNKVKCYGWNGYGQLGLGDTLWRGSSLSHMGNNLPFIDFGTNTTVVSLHSGSFASHNCAIISSPSSYSQRIKCWGFNMYYFLGYGDTNDRGNEFGEMGDNLPLVDLGTESRVKQIAIGGYHTCALLISNVLKCWRMSGNGQGAPGSVITISSTGNLIPSVLIDSGKVIKYVTAGSVHTCITYDDKLTMKCFGSNYAGVLGYGDTNDRGNSPTTMIPYIPAINLGTDSLEIIAIYSGPHHNCAVFVDSSVKCFGFNICGQLGIGSVNNIGDGPGEMGNNLKFMTLFSVPTSPSNSPVPVPTIRPTTYPTNLPTNFTPTSQPIPDPSISPTQMPAPIASVLPTAISTISPSATPTKSPILNSTSSPKTKSPSMSPSSLSTKSPTNRPNLSPTYNTTIEIKNQTTANPTLSPTSNLTSMQTKLSNDIKTIAISSIIGGFALLFGIILLIIPRKHHSVAFTVFVCFTDLATDIFYICVSEYASPILYYLSIVSLISPAVFFMVATRYVLYKAFLHTFPSKFMYWINKAIILNNGIRKQNSKYSELSEVIVSILFYVLKFTMIFVCLVFAPLFGTLTYLAYVIGYFIFVFFMVHLKLGIFPKVIKMAWRFSGAEPRSDITDHEVYALNISILAEVLCESIPQTIIVIVNNAMLGTNHDTVFKLTLASSILSILNCIYPILYRILMKRSCSEGCKQDRFGITPHAEPPSSIKIRLFGFYITLSGYSERVAAPCGRTTNERQQSNISNLVSRNSSGENTSRSNTELGETTPASADTVTTIAQPNTPSATIDLSITPNKKRRILDEAKENSTRL